MSWIASSLAIGWITLSVLVFAAVYLNLAEAWCAIHGHAWRLRKRGARCVRCLHFARDDDYAD